MKTIYIDIMEKALSAYTEKRILDYIEAVKNNGLSEHGFPRLTANIGILLAFGRRPELLSTFIEMMNLCCQQMPKRKAANDFSIREICCCLILMEKKKIINQEYIHDWKNKLSKFDPWKYYSCIPKTPDTPVGNWAAYAALSEWTRGIFCGIDTSEFVDWEISSLLPSFDEVGMYKDPHNPIVYDGITRLLLGTLLQFGYNGKQKQAIETLLLKSARITAQMQSVTGEIPYGGRSNQFLFNEAYFAALFEYYATFFKKSEEIKSVGEWKAAAILSQKALLNEIEAKPISHIKNRYPVDSLIGCEGYGYFNKYMITTASFAWLAYLLADDSIIPTESLAEKGGYVACTSNSFHKVFFNSHGYFAQFDTQADFCYDANGLGRLHKAGCPPQICLSVPFPAGQVNYKTEFENPRPMSICCFAQYNKTTYYGSEAYAKYSLVRFQNSDYESEIVFECTLSDTICVIQKYSFSSQGLTISLSGCETCGFMLPVFCSDGAIDTEIKTGKNFISVSYKGAICEYTFDGDCFKTELYCNRNGRYQVFAVSSKTINICIK